MPYRFALKRQDYSDYASGRVFYHLPGHPTFPIRLGMEVFERCMAIRTTGGASGPVRMYDPCCGEAYHLAVLTMFYWQSIAEIIGSDIDPGVLSVARRNLSLLTAEGLDRRIHEIGQLSSTYGKASHAQALVSAAALKQKLADNTRDHAITTHFFQADAGDQAAIYAAVGAKVDLVITDIPYGQKSSWQFGVSVDHTSNPVSRMLAALTPILADQAVVAVISMKHNLLSHPDYAAAGKLKLGLRLVTFLRPRAR